MAKVTVHRGGLPRGPLEGFQQELKGRGASQERTSGWLVGKEPGCRADNCGDPGGSVCNRQTQQPCLTWFSKVTPHGELSGAVGGL